MSTFSSTKIHKSFSAGLLLVSSSPSLYTYLGLPWPKCDTLHLALLNLIKVHAGPILRLGFWMAFLAFVISSVPLNLVLLANLLRMLLIKTFQTCPGRSGWMASHPSTVSTALLSLVSLVNLLRAHSIPLSISLIKMLKSTSPNVDPWGAQLMTGLYLPKEPLTTNLWLCPFSHLFIHQLVQPSSLPSLETNPGRRHLLPSLCLPSFYHRRPPDWSGMFCPWWSWAGCLGSPPHLVCGLTSLPGFSAPSPSQTGKSEVSLTNL